MTDGERGVRLERQLEALAAQVGRLAESVARLEAEVANAAKSRELARDDMREVKASLVKVSAGLEEYRRDKRGAWGVLVGLSLSAGGIGAGLTRWLGGQG